ncbi:MAG: FecR domain-containing protein [Candidatus Omnitrophota bacterium]
MRNKASVLCGLWVVSLLVFLGVNSVYAEESTYGHVSYLEGNVIVSQDDQSENVAIVNLPLLPGDQIVTDAKSRCEIQFDNGTIIRVDQDSRLQITTILAPSLTSDWKITTLHLLKGQIYAMTRTYNREMFQIITPTAALDLKKSSSVGIRLTDNGDTHVYSDRGKLSVMYGENVNGIKTDTIKSGKTFVVTNRNTLRPGDENEKRDLGFVAWNEYVTNHFKDLHTGINKVPPVLDRYKNNALTYWAEKWSSVYGQWIYDEVFGYVWKPADERFAYSKRPFFHADFVKINGQLVLVPQEPWGWVPAHMGTWVWTKSGWTWIPGNIFHSVFQKSFNDRFYCSSLDYYVISIFGSYDLYWRYRRHGLDDWREAYYKEYGTRKVDPIIKHLPEDIRTVIKKLDKAPMAVVKERLDTHSRVSGDMGDMKTPSAERRSVDTPVTPIVKPITPPPANIAPTPASRAERAEIPGRVIRENPTEKHFRDWNPDWRWATKNGVNIEYSTRKNAVVLPEFGTDSRSLTHRERAILKDRSSIQPSNYRGSEVITNGTVEKTVVAPVPTTEPVTRSNGVAKDENRKERK